MIIVSSGLAASKFNAIVKHGIRIYILIQILEKIFEKILITYFQKKKLRLWLLYSNLLCVKWREVIMNYSDNDLILRLECNWESWGTRQPFRFFFEFSALLVIAGISGKKQQIERNVMTEFLTDGPFLMHLLCLMSIDKPEE